VLAPTHSPAKPVKTRLWADVAEGISWLWQRPFLRVAVFLVAGSNFAFSAIILALIVRGKNLGASPGVIGIMLAFSGGGALVGSVIAPWVQRRVHAKVVVIGALWIWALAALSCSLRASAARRS
jgi:MFS-type transporter involved in bile tolerance (Atg22 family)